MNNKNLIVYFSRTGNTRKLAEKISKISDGVLFEIHPEIPYSDDYNMVLNQAKEEISNGSKPFLKNKIDNIKIYETIFIGSPNWWNTIAPPVATFLSSYDFSEKNIMPFCTHGGGGQGHIVKDVSKLCPNSIILDCLEVYGSAKDIESAKVLEWIKYEGIIN